MNARQAESWRIAIDQALMTAMAVFIVLLLATGFLPFASVLIGLGAAFVTFEAWLFLATR